MNKKTLAIWAFTCFAAAMMGGWMVSRFGPVPAAPASNAPGASVPAASGSQAPAASIPAASGSQVPEASVPAASGSQAPAASVPASSSSQVPEASVPAASGSQAPAASVPAAASSAPDTAAVQKTVPAARQDAASVPKAVPAAVQDIGQDAAVRAALNHAGVAYSDTLPLTAEYDLEEAAYEIEFWDGGYEYEYEIDAATGTVRKSEKSEKEEKVYTVSYSLEDAKAAAFTHAGCAEGDLGYCNAYLNYDDGAPEYFCVDFCWGGTEYEYEISCHDCSVLECERGACGHHWEHSGNHHPETHHQGHHY